ncbi:Flp family type IVb pilin [Roseateles sp.]|uniref:Flp family type IVb pilin n=1 Tax=Roseateles sp. TaxID=1971397 RepID=UPI0025D63345|nr:Flp family type IVb pilin [Roseateles sp.]MBV8036196.1 Flp family type IVb pilin [Roseateles sp.]
MEQQRTPQHRRPLLVDESAVTAIEYGLLAALIGLAILGAITVAGTSLVALYQYWSAAVVAAL